jgi:hypothetical protein
MTTFLNKFSDHKNIVQSAIFNPEFNTFEKYKLMDFTNHCVSKINDHLTSSVYGFLNNASSSVEESLS